MCKLCPFTSKSESAFQSHSEWIHFNAYPFTCDICDFTTKRTAQLIRHKTVVHNLGKMPQRCYECDFSCFTPGELKQHIKKKHITVHNDKRDLTDKMHSNVGRTFYPCDKCFYLADKKGDLEKHKKSRHSDSYERLKKERNRQQWIKNFY